MKLILAAISVVLFIGYRYHHFSGIRSIDQTAISLNSSSDPTRASKSSKDKTEDPQNPSSKIIESSDDKTKDLQNPSSKIIESSVDKMKDPQNALSKSIESSVDKTKDLLDASSKSVESSKDKTNDPQNASLKFLRDEVKSHVSIVPGAGYILDTVFDSLDEVSELHSEEANELVAGTVEELRNAIKDEPFDVTSAHKVLIVLATRGIQLNTLASRASGDLQKQFLNKVVTTLKRRAGEASKL